jgi:hypothetical protein
MQCPYTCICMISLSLEIGRWSHVIFFSSMRHDYDHDRFIVAIAVEPSMQTTPTGVDSKSGVEIDVVPPSYDATLAAGDAKREASSTPTTSTSSPQ